MSHFDLFMKFGKRFGDHFSQQAMGRHHHHSRGGGPFGRRFGGANDGDDFPRGRKFSSEDLQLLLLVLLAEKPSHGYELIKGLEDRSGGFYSPSPGMLYPALTHMEDLGQVSVQVEGNRKSYALTDTGRAFLAANREHADMLLAILGRIARKMDMFRRAMADDAGAAEEAGDWIPELVEARRNLKRLLMQSRGVAVKEQKRIAQILNEAAIQIANQIDNKSNNDDDII